LVIYFAQALMLPKVVIRLYLKRDESPN